MNAMFRSLSVRNYRLYAGGQLVSLTGTWIQRVAQDWLVLELTNSATALGVVTALQFGPTLVLSLYGGVLADRGDKRRLLVMTQSAMAVVALILGLLTVSHLVNIWQLMVLALLSGVISSLDSPIRQSFVVEMVGAEDLPNAVALNSTTFNVGRIIGPAVAGVLIASLGTGWAFLVNALSSVAVVSALLVMDPTALFPAPPVVRGRGQLRQAWTYLGTRPDLQAIMGLIFLVGTFGLNFQMTTALLAKQVFGRGAQSFGLLATALAIGAALGAVFATRRSARPSMAFLLLAALVFGLLETVAGSLPQFWLTAAALVPAGLMMLTLTTATNSAVQLGVEPTMRGRIMALYLMCFMGGTPIGAPIVGWLAQQLGPRWGMIGGGVVSTLAAVAVAVWYAHRRGGSVRGLAMVSAREHRDARHGADDRGPQLAA